MQRISMSAAELQALRAELAELESAGRAQIAARIKTAREWGDLKENGEYHAAKEAQAHLETRILRLREQLRSAEVVEHSAGGEAVQHGSTVTVFEAATGRRQSYRIVAPSEARRAEGVLSSASPLARALLGRRVGEQVEVVAPARTRVLMIESIA
jgi:transcription elongation factor GreA